MVDVTTTVDSELCSFANAKCLQGTFVGEDYHELQCIREIRK